MVKESFAVLDATMADSGMVRESFEMMDTAMAYCKGGPKPRTIERVRSREILRASVLVLLLLLRVDIEYPLIKVFVRCIQRPLIAEFLAVRY